MDVIYLPEQAQNIILSLNKKGYQAYAVGGCVRDTILGIVPSDWDIATDAHPQQVKSVFSRTADTGTRHGTVTVLMGDEGYEVTTFRTEGEYSDLRHPDRVCFTHSIEEDLGRRDFTINALAYHPQKGLVDCCNGLSDLKGRLIRAVGNAGSRFREDALRMLRAVRFSAQLGFEIEEKTLRAVRDNSQLIKNISTERIRDELTGILMSKNPLKFILVWETGLLHNIIPELCRVYCSSGSREKVLELLRPLEYAISDCVLRWSLLLATTENTRDIMKRLRFDNKTSGRVTAVTESMGLELEPDPRQVRKAVHITGKHIFSLLIEAWEAIASSCHKDKNGAGKVKKIFNDIIREGHPLEICDLEVDGADIAGMGFVGTDIGRVLRLLLDMVIDDPGMNKREFLLKAARMHMEKTDMT